MRTTASPDASHISNFMICVLLRGFASGIGSNLASVLSQPHLSMPTEGAVTVASALTAVMRAALSICAEGRIFDGQDLDEVLMTVRKQFKVADECNKADELVALSCLEHVHQLVEQNARCALREAKSGFPVSNGDFAVWEQARVARSHPARTTAA